MDLTDYSREVISALRKNASDFALLLPPELSKSEVIVSLDLSQANTEISLIHTKDAKALEDYIWSKLVAANAKVGIGGYAEDRRLYSMSETFVSGQEPRSVHLGIDLWTDAETPLT